LEELIAGFPSRTVRIFVTKCKEHILAISNNNGNSECSDYILNTGHAYVSITGTLKVIKIEEKKGKHLNTLEKYHIHVYKISKNRLHMSEAYIDANNPVFEAMREVNNRQRQIHIIKE
jgi:hypothetical protein